MFEKRVETPRNRNGGPQAAAWRVAVAGATDYWNLNSFTEPKILTKTSVSFWLDV